jgi:hypothetical protein
MKGREVSVSNARQSYGGTRRVGRAGNLARSETVYRRVLKRRFMPMADDQGPCRVQAAQGRADTPRPKKELTEAQRKARKHAAAKMRAAWLTGQDRRCD